MKNTDTTNKEVSKKTLGEEGIGWKESNPKSVNGSVGQVNQDPQLVLGHGADRWTWQKSGNARYH